LLTPWIASLTSPGHFSAYLPGDVQREPNQHAQEHQGLRCTPG